jgi:plastocyanin
MRLKDYIIYGVVIVLVIAIGTFLYMGWSKKGPSTPPVPGSEVIYTDSGFSPANLGVKVGDTVTFKNGSSGQMWVASNPHPIHTDLSGFDAKRGYAPGESYSYTFVKPGVWGYHNHLKSSYSGHVTVQ